MGRLKLFKDLQEEDPPITVKVIDIPDPVQYRDRRPPPRYRVHSKPVFKVPTRPAYLEDQNRQWAIAYLSNREHPGVGSRLFTLLHNDQPILNQVTQEPVCFATKTTAKAVRKELQERFSFQTRLASGPDHWKNI